MKYTNVGWNDSFTPAFDLAEILSRYARYTLRCENVSDRNFWFWFVDSETMRYIACNDATLMAIAGN